VLKFNKIRRSTRNKHLVNWEMYGLHIQQQNQSEYQGNHHVESIHVWLSFIISERLFLQKQKARCSFT